MESSKGWQVVAGLLFWVAVAFAIYWWLGKKDEAEVFLDVSVQPESISGRVTFKGSAVQIGTVHVVVSHARTKRYLASRTLPLQPDGAFSSQGHPLFAQSGLQEPLRISAEFHGASGDPGQPQSRQSALTGGALVYVNTPPPLGDRLRWAGLLGLALLLFMLYLFTGNLPPSKARLLFATMYCFTFLSLAIPILVSLVVAQNKYLVDAMEASPIGLITARAKGLTEEQWLINIGGTVVRESAARTPPDKGKGAPAQPADSPAKPEAGGETPAAVPGVPADRTTPSSRAPTIEGGLAVPFYVVLLAMFGAGINMTLKVPEIQRSYELDVSEQDRSSPSLWLSPFMLFQRTGAPATQVPKKTVSDIRRDLIENYMYLLSAPFLAIGMYYLLQVLAEQVTQPVLVVMAFATGLVSKAVIGGIIRTAEEKLLLATNVPPRTGAEAEAVANAAARQAEEAKVQIVQAQARLNEAEAKVKAAEKERLSRVMEQAAMKLTQSADAVKNAAAELDAARGRQRDADAAAAAAEQAAGVHKAEAGKDAGDQEKARQAENADKEARAKRAAADGAKKAVEEAEKVAATANEQLAAAQQAHTAAQGELQKLG